MNVIEQRRIRLIFGLLGNLFGAGAGIVNGVINRKAQQKENERDRQFNAEEAQKQRDWQERMYHENESPQAQVQQQLQAGLNPFANGASSQSVGSGSTASAGSSSLPSAPPISDFIAGIPQAMLGIKQTKSEIANTEADTQVKLSQARTEWFNSIIAETNALNRQAIIDAEIAGLQETTGLTRAQRKENEIRVKMLEEFRNNGGNTFTDDSNLTNSQISYNESQTRLNGVLSLLNHAKIDTERASVRKIVADTLLSETETLLKQQQIDHNTTMFPLMEQYQSFMNSLKLSEAAQAQIKAQLEKAWQNPQSFGDINVIVGDILRKLIAD